MKAPVGGLVVCVWMDWQNIIESIMASFSALLFFVLFFFEWLRSEGKADAFKG